MIAKIHTKGFSLLEIMIALAIFAVMSVAVYHQINAVSTAAIRIEQKYYALWVAENILEQYFINREWPSTGDDIADYEMAGREWHVKTEIKDDENPDIKVLETSVYEDKSSKSPVVTLYRMMGKN